MVLASLILMTPLLLSAKAQSRVTSPQLEGTTWQARISWKNSEEISTSDFAEYVLGKQGRVKFRYISVVEISVIRLAPKPRKYLDDLSEYERKKDTSTDIRNTRGDGTYEQKGNVIHLEFSDHTIDASIKRDSMEGFIAIKSTGERGLWDAENILNRRAEEAASSINPARGYQELVQEARRLEGQKHYRQAIENYTAAIKLDPSEEDKLDAHRWRGNANLELKEYRDAIADYDFCVHQYEYMLNTKGPGRSYSETYSYKVLLGLVYNSRATAKEGLGDRVGACADFRMSCRLRDNTYCVNSQKVCN